MSKEEFSEKSGQLQEVLEEEARRLGRATGFVQRASKMSAEKFVQTLVLGVMGKGDSTLNDWVQVAGELGVEISEQGLQERINERGVALLRGLLEKMLVRLQNQWPMPGAVLQQFQAVYVVDSSIVTLPKAMAEQFAGFASAGSEAALKMQLSYEYLRGNLSALEVGSGRTNDPSCTLVVRQARTGSLHIQDLGYFDQDDLAAIDAVQAYFVSRLKYGTALYAHPQDAKAVDLLATLHRQTTSRYECQVFLGVRQHLPVRLVCQRLPEQAVAQRRRKALAAARKKGHPCAPAYLDWLAWNIFVTNTTPDQLTFQQVLDFYRIRWQIELIFKVWKSQARLAQVGDYRAERVLCSLFARLLALVIFHWLLAPWRVQGKLELSFTKAFHVLQHLALRLLDSIADLWRSTPTVLARIVQAFLRFAPKDSRRKRPSSYRRLLYVLP